MSDTPDNGTVQPNKDSQEHPDKVDTLIDEIETQGDDNSKKSVKEIPLEERYKALEKKLEEQGREKNEYKKKLGVLETQLNTIEVETKKKTALRQSLTDFVVANREAIENDDSLKEKIKDARAKFSNLNPEAFREVLETTLVAHSNTVQANALAQKVLGEEKERKAASISPATRGGSAPSKTQWTANELHDLLKKDRNAYRAVKKAIKEKKATYLG